ncbi:MAG TPA: discoidin domain-containing protein, partial [Thermoanaerobaculia bacterium]|nr:discoidin domain-containing protein [Thermoanaerobaculia bacterium]
MRGTGGRAAALLFIAAACALLGVSAAAPESPEAIDDFESIAAWKAAPSAGVKLELSSAEGIHGRALRLDFDFAGRAGWAAARRSLDLDLPENYELSFAVRGAARANDLEIKLVDSSGENVWWSVRRDFEPPSSWSTVRIKKRHLTFAWGPAGGGEIRHAAAIELTVTARAGGSGWIAFDDLTLTPLPPPGPPAHPPILTASAAQPGFEAPRAMDGDPATAWETAGAGPAWIQIDFGERREFGGLTIEWEPRRFARRYQVAISEDGAAWTTARTVEDGNGGRDDLYLPESDARYVRLDLAPDPSSPGFAIREIVVQPLSFSESPNVFFEAIARGAPRGAYPRSFSGEQSYWTVVGVDGDTENALLSEDGAVERRKGSFSVEPFLLLDGKLATWADAEISHSLKEGDLPIPTVTWRLRAAKLAITALADGLAGRSSLRMRYRISNPQPQPLHGRLYLAIRPFLVDPPTQFLNGPGGATPIREIARDGTAVVVGGERVVFSQTRPSGFGAAPFDQGPITEFLARGGLPRAASVRDGFGYASAALAFDLEVPAGASQDVILRLPIHTGAPEPGGDSRTSFQHSLEAVSRTWRSKLGRVVLIGPEQVRTLARIVRTNLAYALIERDGPALRPGTRSYARSWIRDGALIAQGLLRLGQPDVARAYAEWFAPFQDPDGRVPCCVDRRGADPVPENDSHGELLFLIGEVERFTADRAFLDRMLPHAERAVAYIDRLRQTRRTEAFRESGKLPFFGLLPESISHEGYSAKPVHSYWDDFWALTGLREAAAVGAAANRRDLARNWTAIADEFERDLLASLARTIASRGLDYVPGSAELADLDPTSTTIALDPAGLADRLPQPQLTNTFERYSSELQRRITPGAAWDAYTPYESRMIGAFVRLRWRNRIPALLDFFLAGRRPAAWNQWAEVVGREVRKPRFVGDMPHAWAGA